MAKKAKIRASRASGKLTGRMVEDLCRRLQEQVNIAEALEAATRSHGPHGEVIVASSMLRVLALAMAHHAEALRQVTLFAKIISEGRPA